MSIGATVDRRVPALNAILSAAMYRFAITGLVVTGFREADMWRAFCHG
jgi:hypothetical protein